MIKIGSIQENLYQQEEQYHGFEKSNKKLDKELKKLCSINNNNANKIQGKISKKAKLFVNTQFNPLKT
jgi:hypothetical protein